MFNTEDFKKSVLDRAMRGKLTKQLPEDGDAKDLLKQIDAEKETLIKAKKIKAQKPMPEIAAEEIPFEIPDNWQWVRLGEINDVRDGTHNTPKYVDDGIPLITSKNIKNGVIEFDNVKYISEEDSDKINERSNVDINDILMPMIGTIGNPAINKSTRKFSIKNVALIKNNEKIMKEYIFFFILYFQDELRKNSSGAVQSFISLSKVRSILIPLPPLSEQQRIVESIDKCFDLANHIDQEASLTDKFNVDMRKSLLQSAMMGKLTKQLPEDGDASELLDQIKAKKEALVKAKKIKTQKSLPDIAADEIPFEIPDNWRWVRLGEISNIIMGQSPKSKDVSEGLPDNSHFEFHQGKSFFSEKTIDISNKVTISKLRLINKNYILMSVRAPVGDVNLTNRIIALGRGLCGIRPICVNKYYLYYYLMTQKNYLMRKSTGSTFKAINKKTIFEELVPLPPLSEQTRIVNKLDKILDELDG